ncbi:uncharacterized protein Dere_GG13588 [Drosophila erecta]|uniref:LIM zinc-binding domain-containing protein n=1 Tax=Drosophila erecta TaxID=7220 RepID=B3NDG2_DROER|nr:uncharacterized protein Dere_GG13588 [Drosophila erecta]
MTPSPTKELMSATPTISRRPREEFAEKGAIIREVEDGVRCEQCKSDCPGFAAHDWRKTCQSCKCPREAHAIYQQQTTNVHERLGFKLVSPADSGVEARDLGFTWVPPGARASSRINRYFEQLPDEVVPRLGSEGACSRERQISYQLPKQDLSLEHCKHLEVQHEASFEDFVTARNEIALDIAYIKDAPYDEHCAHCDNEIAAGELVVAAPKFVESVMWHPKCFTCSTCNSLLVDLTYCVHDDKVYCERHYAEMLKPRCAGCDELQDDRLAENKSPPVQLHPPGDLAISISDSPRYALS